MLYEGRIFATRYIANDSTGFIRLAGIQNSDMLEKAATIYINGTGFARFYALAHGGDTVPEQSLHRQRLAYLCDNLISAVIAVFLGIVIVGWVFRDIIDPVILFAWVISALIISTFRLWSYFWIKKRLDHPQSYVAMEKLLILTAAATGVLWGIGSMLFAMSTDMFYWVFLAFVLSGYASGSVFSTSASLPACAAYFFPTIMPITGWFFLQDEPRAPLMGVLLLVFIAAAWNVARNANRMLLDKFTLFAEKTALSDSLERRNQQLRHEINERNKTAAELERSHARHQQLLANAPIGLLVVRQNTLVFSNPYWQQLLPESDGTRVADIVQLACSDDRPSLTELLESDEQNAAPRSVNWIRPGQTPMHTEVSALNMDYDGQVATLLLVEDIENRLKAEAAEHLKYESEAYAQRLAALQTMAGGIAHDFNNLLAAIICNTSLVLKKHGAGNPELAGFIARIDDASAQATRLSHQMLAYSGHGAFVVEPLNLSAVITDMQMEMDALTDDNTNVRFELHDRESSIDADPGQVRQMLENLITNASEAYHGQPGVVTVSARHVCIDESDSPDRSGYGPIKPGGYVSLHVTDQGCGMDSETIDSIFDPFFTTKFTGRGLGMSAVFGIVRGLNGDIRIDSRLNEGTDIHILLPASCQPGKTETIQSEPRTSESKVNTSPDNHWTSQGTVLFVDDETILREVASMMLESMGHRVMVAGDGLEALEIYKEHGDNIAFVILDLTMPRMGGKACLAALKAMDPDVRVILSSGYSMNTISSQLGDCTPAAMLQKPYDAETLETIIQGLV